MMEFHATVFYPSPQDALRALQARVAARYDWTIMTGGKHDNARFVIERRVRYTVIRSIDTYTRFTLAGRFTKDKSGETHLRYRVMGQPLMTAVYAGIWLAVIVLFIVLILGMTTLPSTQWIATALVFFLLAVGVGYVWFVVRRYQQTIGEMHDLMVDFTENTGLSSRTR